jgi:hypothetical protein
MTINNKRVHDFYSNNRHIHFETMNILLIEFLDKMNSDLAATTINTINHEILSSVKDMSSNLTTLNSDIVSRNNAIVVKFHEINKEFVENMKNMVGNTMSTNTDKLYGLLDKNTEVFIGKMNEFIPKNNEELNRTLVLQLREMQKTILDDLDKKTPDKIEDYFTSLDTKLHNIQQPIFSFISANNDQMASQLTSLRESSALTHASQEKVFHELGDFLNKYKTSSSHKGQFSENKMEGILNNMYPSAEVVNTTSTRATGDFLLKRQGYQTILIENKNYESNVNTDEIKKFMRDIREQNCDGIFISQYSGIVNKSNYFMEIHDGNILVYIHHVDYNPEKIRTAIDIIDNLSIKLKDFQGDRSEGINIPTDVLDSINTEFQVFITQKETLISTVKDTHKKLLNHVEDLKMPDLQLFLNGKYASIQNQDFVCEICGECFAKKNGLASHRKVHNKKSSSK